MELIKADIDEAIKEATKYQEFIDILAFKGYYIKKSNGYISVSTPYYNRNIRLARAFGEDYTFENIKTRIYQPTLYDRYLKRTNNEKVYKVRIYDGIKIDQEKLKTSSFYRLYVYYLYLLGKLPPKIHYEERTKEYYKEIDKFNKLADEIINKINSKIQTCKRIITNAEKGEKEIILINNRALENQQNNEQENSINKNKDKKRIR